MAKAILEFDLNDSDDAMAHLRAVKSLDMAMALWQFAYNTKKKTWWEMEQIEQDGTPVTPYDAVDKVYEKFWEIMEEHGIKLDDLIV